LTDEEQKALIEERDPSKDTAAEVLKEEYSEPTSDDPAHPLPS